MIPLARAISAELLAAGLLIIGYVVAARLLPRALRAEPSATEGT